MNEDIKEESTMEKTQQQEPKKKRKMLIMILLLLLLVSSIGVSLMLNKHLDEPPVVDNITIEPIEKRSIHVSGQVTYSDGKVFQNGHVQLHSDVMDTTTDENGWFLFREVDPAEHTLSVLDDDGNVLAKAYMNVEQGRSDKNFHIRKNKDGNYVVQLSTNIRYLELKVEVNGQNLLLIPEETYAVTDKGQVFTQDGQLKVKDGQIVLPSGTVILENNNIIHYPYIVEPDNTVISIPKDGMTLDDGVKVEGDGTIVFPDSDTEIDNDRNEVIDNENGTTTDIPNDKPSNITPDGDVKPIEPSEPDKPADPDTPIDPDKPVDPDKPIDPDKPVDPDDPKPDVPDTPEGYSVVGRNKLSWTSPWDVKTPLTALDLFDTGRRNKDNIPIIEPGSEGSYIFQIENKRDTALNVQIKLAKLSDDEFPLEYRLSEIPTVESVVPNSTEWKSLKDGNLVLSDDGTIGSGSSKSNVKLYRLEWRWPFERSDAKDTELGKKQAKFELKLSVHVEEVESK